MIAKLTEIKGLQMSFGTFNGHLHSVQNILCEKTLLPKQNIGIHQPLSE